MRSVMVVVAVGLAAGGCAANMQWVKPGATAADFQRDKLQCEYEAKVATPGRYSGRGMSSAIADGIADGMRLNELGTLCMQTRGYTLTTAANAQAINAAANAGYSAPEPAPRRNLKPAEAIAEARKHLATVLTSPKFANLRYVSATSATGDPTDVVCGTVSAMPFVYFVDQRDANLVDGAQAAVNGGIYRSFCERDVAGR